MTHSTFKALFIGFVVLSAAITFADTTEQYINDDYGVMLTVPSEWSQHEKGYYNAIVEFGKGKSGTPACGIFVSNVPSDFPVMTDFDATKAMAEEYRSDSNTVILQEPGEMTVNDISGSRFSFGAKDSNSKTIFYQFLIHKDIITIFGIYEHDAQRSQLLEILNSFRLADAEHSFRQLFTFKNVTPDFRPTDAAEYALLKEAVIKAVDSVGSFKSRYVMRDLTDETLSDVDFRSVKWNMIFASLQEFEVEKIKYPQMTSEAWRIVGENIYEKFNTWMESPDLSFDAKIDPRVKKGTAAKKDIYNFLTVKKYTELFNHENPVGIFDDQNNGYLIFDFEPRDADFLLLDQLNLKAKKIRLWVWVDKKDHMVRFVRLVFRGFDAQGNAVKHKHDHAFRAINETFSLGAPPLQ